jgi:hypothetical protein
MKSSRRWFLRAAAAVSGAVVAACRGTSAPEPQPSLLGAPITPYGERSPFEKSTRLLSTRTYMEEA